MSAPVIENSILPENFLIELGPAGQNHLQNILQHPDEMTLPLFKVAVGWAARFFGGGARGAFRLSQEVQGHTCPRRDHFLEGQPVLFRVSAFKAGMDGAPFLVLVRNQDRSWLRRVGVERCLPGFSLRFTGELCLDDIQKSISISV